MKYKEPETKLRKGGGKMKYVYPAVFTPAKNGEYDVHIPDLPYCRTCGKDLPEAIEMAEDALAVWLWDAENNNEQIPSASKNLKYKAPQFVSLVMADMDIYRRTLDNKSIKKTLTIPAWLNAEAEKAHINFSGILQSALKEHLNIKKDKLAR